MSSGAPFGVAGGEGGKRRDCSSSRFLTSTLELVGSTSVWRATASCSSRTMEVCMPTERWMESTEPLKPRMTPRAYDAEALSMMSRSHASPELSEGGWAMATRSASCSRLGTASSSCVLMSRKGSRWRVLSPWPRPQLSACLELLPRSTCFISGLPSKHRTPKSSRNSMKAPRPANPGGTDASTVPCLEIRTRCHGETLPAAPRLAPMALQRVTQTLPSDSPRGACCATVASFSSPEAKSICSSVRFKSNFTFRTITSV